ncbi:hypothetical protein SSX86_003432 [Deinandra increscens subsp. villosa]|uniref:N-acetyltransferase domain-containing protein n=1 Tax=Deinandra increscens subsp. villosa TaxID=3103831 RepID=A0AAP0DQ56_9ASTR
MAFLPHKSSPISMELRRTFSPSPPPISNLFLSIKTPRFLFLFVNKVNKSQQLYRCTSVSSSDQKLQELVVDDVGGGGGGGGGDGWDGKYDDGEGQFGNLVREHGWQVRRMVEEDEEMRSVANIQAEAFHEPVVLFNGVFFQFFQAEVLAGLLYRLKNSPSDRYACLVAEATTSDCEEKQQLVGVVDATVFREHSVLEHLSGADEYLYVSGIAVLRNFRRKKVASVLLKSCETLARFWGYKYLVLRAYEDDLGARTLYANAGYKLISSDPVWTTSWIGRRRRVLMIKQYQNSYIYTRLKTLTTSNPSLSISEIPTRRRRQAGEDRRPAERTRTLLPVKLFSDAIGVKNVAAPAELAKHVVLIVIRGANKAHPIDGSMAVILQIFEPDNRQIHEADVLLVEARVNAAVSEEIRDGVSDEIEEIGFDSEDGEEEADVEDEVHDHHEIPTRRRRQAGEDRRPAERTRTLLPVKLFSDAIGVKNVAAPAELAKHVVLIVIRGANKTHPIDGSMAVVLQIFEPNNRQIHEADVLLVEARVNAAVSEEIRDGVSDEIEEIGFDSEDGEEEADVEDEVYHHHGELVTCFVCLKFGDWVKWEVWGFIMVCGSGAPEVWVCG